MKWPTYDELEDRAKKASSSGFRLKMELVKEFWTWQWLHVPSGMMFLGKCNTDAKPVALSCALQSVPIVNK